MKIISNYYDYYDFIGNGNDEDKVVYLRKRYTDEKTLKELCYGYSIFKNESFIEDLVFDENTHFHDHFPEFIIEDREKYGFRKQYEAAYVNMVVCGKIFTILMFDSDKKTFSIRDDKYNERSGKRFVLYDPKKHSKYFYRGCPYKNINIECGKETEYARNLCKIVKLPVFLVKRDFDHTNNKRICSVWCPPSLRTIEMEKVYSSEQLYQDIEYYITNVINESPDMMPKGNPEMTNNEKILSKGFDLKTSFRKRKA